MNHIKNSPENSTVGCHDIEKCEGGVDYLAAWDGSDTYECFNQRSWYVTGKWDLEHDELSVNGIV